ncbi:PREDICTED: acrosin-like [Gekko japonicus]|uniref:Acrosin-like n=1 Tax=Gekko japonicus TaxID=146911 RepID=A0ABM1KX70_GEKJA|nr:PREDICTED: acrosin-like [Gekko japonicus]
MPPTTLYNGFCGSRVQTEGLPPGTWPWLVSIQLPEVDGDGYRHWCGGTLINSRWVLSAAHCFGLKRYIKVKFWRVVVGITQLLEEDPEAQIVYIERLVEHENYNRIGYLNDIALIELNRSVVCNDRIQLACLPDSSLSISQLSHCYFTGWGSTHANKNIMKLEIMQEVKVSLLDTAACNSSRWYFKRIRDNNLCALPETGSKEACQGAGGGPLMCWEGRSERFWVVGINSWWSGCTEIRMPSVFISTQRFASWILRVTREADTRAQAHGLVQARVQAEFQLGSAELHALGAAAAANSATGNFR